VEATKAWEKVSVRELRELYKIPGQLEVKPMGCGFWKYSKTFNGLEFVYYEEGGEE
jgi:hypothetical protein